MRPLALARSIEGCREACLAPRRVILVQDTLSCSDVEKAHCMPDGVFGVGGASVNGTPRSDNRGARGAADAHIAGITLDGLPVGLSSGQWGTPVYHENCRSMLSNGASIVITGNSSLAPSQPKPPRQRRLFPQENDAISKHERVRGVLVVVFNLVGNRPPDH